MTTSQAPLELVDILRTYFVDRNEPAAGGGEANTSSNLGTGEGLAAPKVGVNLPFKSLIGGTNVNLSSDANEVTIDSIGQSNTTSNQGGGAGIALPKVGANLPFKSLVGGTNITLVENPFDITINGAGGGGDEDGFYNNFCNSQFIIDQELNAGGVTTDSQHVVDQWVSRFTNSGGTYSLGRGGNSDPAGKVPYQLSMVVNGATYVANTLINIAHLIEANFCQELTRNPSGFFVSFRVATDTTGTYCFSIRDTSGANSYVVDMNLTAGVWQTVSINVSIPSFSITPNNGVGLRVNWSTGTGTTFQTPTTNAWVAGNFLASTAISNPANATLTISEPMLSPYLGTFKPNNFTQDLRWCYRYFEKSYNLDAPIGGVGNLGIIQTVVATGGGANQIPGPAWVVPKRANVALTIYSHNGTINRLSGVTAADAESVVGVAESAEKRTRALIVSPNIPALDQRNYHYVANSRIN